jgi:hypothetical protein
MTDTTNIQVVIFDGRPRPVAEELTLFLSDFPHRIKASEIIGVRTDKRIDRYRNEVAAWFLSVTDWPFLLMVDDDAVPVKETAELFKADGWVLGADFISRRGERAHYEDGGIGFCMALIDRRALERLPKEPFSLDPGDGCECGAFCRRCREAGMWPRKAGKVGHALTLYVTPEGPGCKIRFPDAPPVSPARRRNEQLGVAPPPDAPWSNLGGSVVLHQAFVSPDASEVHCNVDVR